MVKISLIIPFKGSTATLPRLFQSIPEDNDIEIILVENSDTPRSKDEIGITRPYTLLNASENRFAGGARNVGLNASKGRWIIFADADDYFAPGAFDLFRNYNESTYDLIYFGCNSVYDDSLLPANRHIPFNSIVQRLKSCKITELKGKLSHVVPWAKMIRRDLIIHNNIEFDEVIAANDIMFATKCAVNSKNFGFDDRISYIVTVRKGSLANSWSKEILKSRYEVGLRRNKYFKNHNLGNYQVSVMYYIYKSLFVSPILVFEFLYKAIKYKQNLFIGFKNWISTFRTDREDQKINKNYIEIQ